MPTYHAPLQDMQFVLHDVLAVSQSDLPAYQDLDPDFCAAILGEAGKIATQQLAPLNNPADQTGCMLENGAVITPKGFKAAFDTMRTGGWCALNCDPAYGGQGLPYILSSAVGEIFAGANMAFNMYQGLTHGAYSAIHAHGTQAQKDLYLPKLTNCHWTGTMNLTEPQCGTDLGLIRTSAQPQNNGSYRITGQKIFISAGDHDLAENIIHLVLARAPNGGEGTKGISLFIVPKFLPLPDGSLGPRNALSVGKVEHKMGIHGNATCVMNYDGAIGFLLGDLHKGMRAMFTMMNEARLGVGLQGYAQAEAACQNALTYAKERLQGRAVTGAQDPDRPADPLICHPDIRRNLMDQKAFIEGGRALAFWGAGLIDRHTLAGDEEAGGLIGLLTPIIKGFLTDKGFEMAVQAQQIYGGHGYIEETGMSQFVRDSRITMIYEGANGIQALDLVGRKLAQDGGKHVMALMQIFKAEAQTRKADPKTSDLVPFFDQALQQMQGAIGYFMDQGLKNPQRALSGAYDFMSMMGHICVGHMWLRMAGAAGRMLEQAPENAAFYQAKLITARHYMQRHLPICALYLARITAPDDTVMALLPGHF